MDVIRFRGAPKYDRPVSTRLSIEHVMQLVAMSARERRPVAELVRRAVERMLADEDKLAAG